MFTTAKAPAQPEQASADYAGCVLVRRPARHQRRVAALAALACLAILVPAPGAALAAPAPKHHASAPPLPADTTPLPRQVVEAGAPAKTSTSSGQPTAASSSGSIVRMIAGLAIVLAVIYAVYWLLKTYAKSKRGGDPSDDRLTVLGTTTLAPNRSLHLVRVGQEVLLLGSAEQSVTPIRAYSVDELRRLGVDLDELDLRQGGRGGRPGQSGSMLEALRRMTAR
jgi:flagellar protein FliO/FliZ